MMKVEVVPHGPRWRDAFVVSAQPVGLGRLSIDQEVAVIQRGFEPLVEAGLVEIETLARATPSMIHGRLTTGKYQVVHFIGHGVYDEERGEGCLLSLVFLNSCESGRGGRADFNKGVAQSLVAHGLPALGDVDSHQRGAKDCPMAFNEERDFAQVVGRQKFDADCRKKLKPRLGAKFDALEALLKTFSAVT